MGKKSNRPKMTKDVVPSDFTLGLVIVDAIPVLFFCASMVIAGLMFKSYLFVIGALMCLFAGACKVLWKLIVVLRQKNVWWMFLQMRILMPVGLVLMIAGGVMAGRGVSFGSWAGNGAGAAYGAASGAASGATGSAAAAVDFAGIWAQMCSMPASLFFIVGLVLMALMIVFAFTLDSKNVKANWIEQITNGVAQIAFFVGLLICV